MLRYIAAIIVIALVAVGGYYGWTYYQETTSGTGSEEEFEEEPTTATYATSTFSIAYPSDFTVDTRYQYRGVPDKPVDGVKFTIPDRIAAGTNLSSFDTGVSVEWLPRAINCTGAIYVLADVDPFEITDGGRVYSVATTSDAGAGNLYEEMVYAIPDSEPCTAVRYFIHSGNISNYDPGTVEAFDRAALLREFDAIRRSLRFGTQATSTATSSAATQ